METGIAWVYDYGQENKLLWKNTLYLESVGSIVYGTCTSCVLPTIFLFRATRRSHNSPLYDFAESSECVVTQTEPHKQRNDADIKPVCWE